MVFKFLYVPCFIFLLSCTTQKQKTEYLEYSYNGSPISRSNDKIYIKFIPNKKDVSIKLNYHGKDYIRKPITQKEYQAILGMYYKINRDSISNKNICITYLDAGASEIIYFKDNIITRNIVLGNSKNGDKYFYKTTVLIYNYAGLDSKFIK